MTHLRLPQGHDERFPQSEGLYPIKKFAAEHEVSEAFYQDKAAFDPYIRSIHDRTMDEKKATRVSEITIKEYPLGAQGPISGREPIGPDYRFVVTLSRGIAVKLEPNE